MMQYLPSLAGVAIVSFIITRSLIPLSHIAGLLYRPDSRKCHIGSVIPPFTETIVCRT